MAETHLFSDTFSKLETHFQTDQQQKRKEKRAQKNIKVGKKTKRREATIHTARNAICSADSKQMVIAGALKERHEETGERSLFFLSLELNT